MNTLKSQFLLIFCLVLAIVLANWLPLPLPADIGNQVLTSLADSPVSPLPPPPDEGDTDDGNSGGDDHNTPDPATEGGVIPGQGGEDRAIHDPDAPGITVMFPRGSALVPIQVEAYYTGLAPNMAPPANGVGRPFFFGVWPRYPGDMITELNGPLYLSIDYDGSLLSNAQEENLHLYLYNPALETWVKLGGKIDIYHNLLTALLTNYTPFAPGQGALLMLGVDDTPPLIQTQTNNGTTTLTLEGAGIKFHIPAGTVPVGSHFEATSASVKGLPALDIRAYQINHGSTTTYVGHEYVTLSNPITLEFEIATDPDDLTILVLYRGRWVEAETLGYKTIRAQNTIALATNQLGSFMLASK